MIKPYEGDVSSGWLHFLVASNNHNDEISQFKSIILEFSHGFFFPDLENLLRCICVDFQVS